MPGEPVLRRKMDPEAAMREYFRQEIENAEVRLPSPPHLPMAQGAKTGADLIQSAAGIDRPGYGLRGNLASLLLAACILGSAALALSCSPGTALARSIRNVVNGGEVERLKEETINAVSFVWQQGQEYFRQKHTGIVGVPGAPAVE